MKKDDHNPELDEMDSVLEVVPTLRGRIIELVFLVTFSFYLAYLLKKIPSYGMYLDTMLGFKMSLLHIKISYDVLAWPLKILSLSSFLWAVFVVLQQKTTKYKLTFLYLEKTEGVFNRESNPMDLVKMKDQKKMARWWERPLGLGRIKIFSSDITDPELLIKHITIQDAEKIHIFLNKFAFSNYNEARIAERREADRQRRRQSKSIDDPAPKRNRQGDVFIDDDGSDEN